MILANTWVSVHRGDDANEYGDATDLDEPVTGLERVPLGITEQSRTTFDPESSEVRMIRYAIGRGNGALDIQADDRLHDLRTDRWWVVRSVADRGLTFFGVRPLQLDLRAV